MIRTCSDKNLTKLNTFGMKVRAASYIEYDSPADLQKIDWKGLAQPVLQLGSGSNLLFLKDFPGTVMRSRIDDKRILEDRSIGDDIYLQVGAGMEMDELCDWTARKGWWGLENLSAIPGTVGAGAVQNVGAYGVEAADVIENVECFEISSGKFVSFSQAECLFAYRDSFFKHHRGEYVVVYVTFHLFRDFRPQLSYGHLQEEVERNVELANATADPYNPVYTGMGGVPPMPLTPMLVRDTVKIIREEKLPDPGKTGSAGSFFKNPVISAEKFRLVEEIARSRNGESANVPHFELPGNMVKVPAAWLIDFCGLKGKQIGGAAVWEKQPLVLVNATGSATSAEIVSLENLIINTIKDTFEIELSPEVDHI